MNTGCSLEDLSNVMDDRDEYIYIYRERERERVREIHASGKT